MSEAQDLSRRERRKLEVRGRILDASVALFDARGVSATKVADICARADVAHKTFFNHFGSKQDLLRELAGYWIDQLLVDVETARKQGSSTQERLSLFFSQVAGRADEGGALHRELVTEIVHAVHGSAAKSEHARKLQGAFGALVDDGLEAGDVTRRHDRETLTEMILGAYYVLMFNFANLDEFPIRKQAAAVARFLADALAPAPEDSDGTP